MNSTEGIVLFGIPHVSHGRVAVANVCRSISANALRYRVTGTDYKIESPKVEALDGSWKQRQQAAVMTINTWNTIQPGRVNRMRLDERGHLPALVEKCVNGRLGIDVQKGFEDLF